MVEAIATTAHFRNGEDIPTTTFNDCFEFSVDSSEDGRGLCCRGEGWNVLGLYIGGGAVVVVGGGGGLAFVSRGADCCILTVVVVVVVVVAVCNVVQGAYLCTEGAVGAHERQ